MLRELAVHDILPTVGTRLAAGFNVHNPQIPMADTVAAIIAVYDRTMLDNILPIGC